MSHKDIIAAKKLEIQALAREADARKSRLDDLWTLLAAEHMIEFAEHRKRHAEKEAAGIEAMLRAR